MRIQFQDAPGDIFDGKCKRNELVIRLQPDEVSFRRVALMAPASTSRVEP